MAFMRARSRKEADCKRLLLYICEFMLLSFCIVARWVSRMDIYCCYICDFMLLNVAFCIFARWISSLARYMVVMRALHVRERKGIVKHVVDIFVILCF